MAQVTTIKVVEGLNNLVTRTFLLNDTGGELENYVLLDPATLSPPLPHKPTFRIMQVWYQLVWFDLTFLYNSYAPRPVWTLARDTNNHTDFRSFGGISDYDTNPPADRDGKLLITTNGFAPVGSQGSFVIEFRKS